MRKRRYPSGQRKDRINTLSEYIRSNLGCRRENIQAYMSHTYGSTLTPKTVSEYLDVLVLIGEIEEKNGRFFIKAGKNLHQKEGMSHE